MRGTHEEPVKYGESNTDCGSSDSAHGVCATAGFSRLRREHVHPLPAEEEMRNEETVARPCDAS